MCLVCYRCDGISVGWAESPKTKQPTNEIEINRETEENEKRKTTHTTQCKVKWIWKWFIQEYQIMHDTYIQIDIQMKTKLQRDQQIHSVYTFTTNMYIIATIICQTVLICMWYTGTGSARAHVLLPMPHIYVYVSTRLNHWSAWMKRNTFTATLLNKFPNCARQAHQYFRFHLCAARSQSWCCSVFTNNIPISLCFYSFGSFNWVLAFCFNSIENVDIYIYV